VHLDPDEAAVAVASQPLEVVHDVGVDPFRPSPPQGGGRARAALNAIRAHSKQRSALRRLALSSPVRLWVHPIKNVSRPTL